MAEKEEPLNIQSKSQQGQVASESLQGLGRHIPEIAIEWAQDVPDELWRTIDGTLCFADISGFTALAERLGALGRMGGEELIETLSSVFGSMLDCTRAYDGTLLKFGGDALLFLFRGKDHATRAACAAVEMRRALRRAAEMPTSVGRLKLRMSVGLHSGRLHLFLVGSPHRELVVAGPEATAVTHVEGAANAGQIAVSPPTAALLPAGATRPRDDGTLLLRWRKPPSPARGESAPREASTETLSGLFPRTLCDLLESGPPEPEHRSACIAFVRFSGTDTLLEQQGPDALAKALQETIGTAGEIFDAEEITLLTIDVDANGGKMFLSAGVPRASEDDEGRMLRALRNLADSDTPLPLQFGVNRGHVFAVEIGTPWRAAYSAMGDTTNTAARICAKAPPDEIYCHPSVLVNSRIQFAADQVGPFVFKGKTTPQTLYRVGQEIGEQAVARTNAKRTTVVREREQRILASAAEALPAGTGSVVSVVGDVGLGKSSLVRHATQLLKGIPVVEIRGEPFRTNRPYGLLRDPIRKLLGIDAQTTDRIAEQLEAAIRDLYPPLLPRLALLGDVAQVHLAPSAEVEAIEINFRPDRAADFVIQILGLLYPGPVAFVVEDAEWADDASAQLLERLSRTCTECGWLMLVSRREESGGFSPTIGEHLTLKPLPPDEIEALVIDATASAPLRPHEIKLVVQRSGGNPLFAEEIIRAGRDAGSFEAVPESLETAIATQADALDHVARRVLRYATILGSSFPTDVLEALLRSEGQRFDATVVPRLQGFLVDDGDGRLRFRNELVRTTIYEGLAYRQRGRLHRVAGETLEQLIADSESIADNLARHFYLAGDFERVWKYARVAATRARHAYANPEAASLYELALGAARRLHDIDDTDKARAWTRLGEVRESAGMFEAALDAFRKATQLVKSDPVTHAKLLVYRAHARERAGAFSAALRELSVARRLIAKVDSDEARKTRAKIESFTAMLRFAQERYREALELANSALPAARLAGDPAALAETLIAAGSAQQALGEGDTSHMLEALKIYEEIGDLSHEAIVRGNLGCVEFMAGRWDAAIEWFKTDRDLCLRIGNVAAAAIAAANIGEIMVKRNQFDAAEPILRDSIRVVRALGFNDGAVYTEILLARVLIDRGEFDEADRMMAGVSSEFARLGQALSALEATMIRALAKMKAGDATAALGLLDSAEKAAGQDARLLAPHIAEVRGRALAELGRMAEAQRALKNGLTSARDYELPYEEAMLLLARIDIARDAGLEPDPQDLEESGKLMSGLGIESTPRPHGQVS